METLRPLLTTYAYNITGSLEEAKDIVQDAYLAYVQADTAAVRDPRAYLIRTVINFSINHKKKQQQRISAYTGEWLPEPVSTDNAEAALIRKDVLSYSLMVLLEQLNARQRAVFILKEAFDYDHAEIAEVIGITEAYSRQVLRRAKKQLNETGEATDRMVDAAQLDKYLELIRTGDMQRLEKMLCADVASTSDGGGKVAAALKPVYGWQDVAAFITGIYRKFYGDALIEKGMINHQPALFYYHDGRIVTCQIFSFLNGRIHRIFFMRDPQKLSALQKNP